MLVHTLGRLYVYRLSPIYVSLNSVYETAVKFYMNGWEVFLAFIWIFYVEIVSIEVFRVVLKNSDLVIFGSKV